MWLTNFFLILLAFGPAASVHEFYKAEARKFVNALQSSINRRNPYSLARHFSSDFLYVGCKYNYTKELMVQKLLGLPNDQNYKLILKSAQNRLRSIKLVVSLVGFSENSVDAIFFLNKNNQQLKSGSVPDCQNRHFSELTDEEGPEVVAEKFLDRMRKSIKSKEGSAIDGLFEPGFFFEACQGGFDKERMVQKIIEFPNDQEYQLILKSSQDSGSSIKFVVLLVGFSNNSIEAVFVLNKNNEQLESGSDLNCQNSNSSGLTSEESPEIVAQNFLERMDKSINSKEESALSDFFATGFVFHGCEGVYGKEKMIEGLLDLSIDHDWNLTVKSAEVDGPFIKFIVTVVSIYQPPIEAVFVLNTTAQQLEMGSIPICNSNLLITEDAEIVSETFLDQLISSVESKVELAVANLFAPGFLLRGCGDIYTKEAVVRTLLALPIGHGINITLKSAEAKKFSIDLVVSVAPIYEPKFDVLLVLNLNGQQLELGIIPECPRRNFPGITANESTRIDARKFLGRMDKSIKSKEESAFDGPLPGFALIGCKGDKDCQKSNIRGLTDEEGPEIVAQKFLDRMNRSIKSKEESAISGLFEPGFVMKGCKGVYNKEQMVKKLLDLPNDQNFKFILKSAQDGGPSIKLVVLLVGFSENPVDAVLVLNKNDEQLERGIVPECQKRHFSELSAKDGSEFFVQKFLDRRDKSIKSKGESAFDGPLPGFAFIGCKGDKDCQKKHLGGLISNDSLDIVNRFLGRMVKSVKSQNASVIAEFFAPGFIFKGCRGTYNKQHVVNVLSNLPAGSELKINLKSAEDLGDSIRYIVYFTGLGLSDIAEQFFLNKKTLQLEKGSIPQCSPQRFHDQSSADEIVNHFLNQIVNSIVSQNNSAISALFAPEFEFQGCSGNYDKQHVVDILSKLPQGTKFRIALKSVKDLGSRIEYTAESFGFGPSPIEAEFVLNKALEQLERGRILVCQKKTFPQKRKNFKWY